jgi:hypothetical protein
MHCASTAGGVFLIANPTVGTLPARTWEATRRAPWTFLVLVEDHDRAG